MTSGVQEGTELENALSALTTHELAWRARLGALLYETTKEDLTKHLNL